MTRAVQESLFLYDKESKSDDGVMYENIDGSDISTTIYSTRPSPLNDALSNRIHSACTRWIEAADFTDAEIATMVEDHAIDILIDMSGQTSGNRLGVFARQPAPIQMSWIGYVGTTGLPMRTAAL